MTATDNGRTQGRRRRPNAGRPRTLEWPRRQLGVNLSAEEYEWVMGRGGAPWVRQLIQRERTLASTPPPPSDQLP